MSISDISLLLRTHGSVQKELAQTEITIFAQAPLSARIEFPNSNLAPNSDSLSVRIRREVAGANVQTKD